MNIKLNLGDSRMKRSRSKTRFDPSILTQIAENVDGITTVYTDRNAPPLAGCGAGLSKGILRVYGDLGCDTASGMSGGILCIKGNVERLSNVFGGMIYVDGNIQRIDNVLTSAQLYCTGQIDRNLYWEAAPRDPSRQVYCANSPHNEIAWAQPKAVKPHRHYLIQVSTTRSSLAPQIMEDPASHLPRLFRTIEARSHGRKTPSIIKD